MVNSGFRGMGVESGAEYVLSAYVRAQPGGPRQLSARLTDDRGQRLAEGALAGFTGEWQRYETTLRPSATHARARLEIAPGGQGEIDIDMVSLYPKETWKNRPNGLRTDLVQLLADMKPGFMRFPGGCIVEGRRLELRYTGRRRSETSADGRPSSTAGTTSSTTGRRRTTSSRSGSGSSSTSSSARTSARAAADSSTAGWHASSTRARLRAARCARSVTSRTRSI